MVLLGVIATKIAGDKQAKQVTRRHRGVIRNESHCAYILTPEDELRIWCYLHKTFLSALRFAAGMRRKEKGFPFLYPAFTSFVTPYVAPLGLCGYL